MKITEIRAYVMNVPAADAETPRRNWIFVEVETDAGVTGIGEATTEHHEMAVAAQVETALKPRLLGMDPTDVEQVWQLGYRDFWWKRGVVHTSAVSGIDMALWDIVGKASGQPVFKLLGGKVRSRVRCYARADLVLGFAGGARGAGPGGGVRCVQARTRTSGHPVRHGRPGGRRG